MELIIRRFSKFFKDDQMTLLFIQSKANLNFCQELFLLPQTYCNLLQLLENHGTEEYKNTPYCI